MSIFEPEDGVPEKIGTLIGAALTLILYLGVLFMMARASGWV